MLRPCSAGHWHQGGCRRSVGQAGGHPALHAAGPSGFQPVPAGPSRFQPVPASSLSSPWGLGQAAMLVAPLTVPDKRQGAAQVVRCDRKRVRDNPVSTRGRAGAGKVPQGPEQRLVCRPGGQNAIKDIQAVAPPEPHPGTSGYGLEKLLTVESPHCSKLS